MNLVAQLKNNSAIAAEAFYDQYGPAIYGIIVRYKKSDDTRDTDSLFSLSFHRIIKYAHLFEPGKMTFFTWIFQTVLSILREQAITKNASGNNLIKLPVLFFSIKALLHVDL